MAAVVCGSLSNLLQGLCEGVGKIACLPCKLCGLTVELSKDVICSPFFFYLAVVVCFNIPPIFMAIIAAVDGSDFGCKLFNWLILNAVLCLTNVTAGFHIAKAITNEDEIEGTEYKLNNISIQQSNPGSSDRIKYVLCYDPTTAIYLMLKGIFILLQVMGLFWALGDNSCGDSSSQFTMSSVFCGVSYIILASCALCMSVFCVKERGNLSYGPPSTNRKELV